MIIMSRHRIDGLLALLQSNHSTRRCQRFQFRARSPQSKVKLQMSNIVNLRASSSAPASHNSKTLLLAPRLSTCLTVELDRVARSDQYDNAQLPVALLPEARAVLIEVREQLAVRTPKRELAKMIAAASLAWPVSKLSDDEHAARLKLYVEMLADEPAIGIASSFRSLVKTSRFFPSIAEIVEMANEAVAKIRRLEFLLHIALVKSLPDGRLPPPLEGRATDVNVPEGRRATVLRETKARIEWLQRADAVPPECKTAWRYPLSPDQIAKETAATFDFLTRVLRIENVDDLPAEIRAAELLEHKLRAEAREKVRERERTDLEAARRDDLQVKICIATENLVRFLDTDLDAVAAQLKRFKIRTDPVRELTASVAEAKAALWRLGVDPDEAVARFRAEMAKRANWQKELAA
jgi:hypothetical protein